MTDSGKGQDRRRALVEAGAALVAEQGLRSLSHRAVATRAGLPLAATTYYFSSLDELRREAAALLAARSVDAAARYVDALPERPLGARAAASRVVSVVLAPDLGSSQVLALYERYLEAARSPAVRDVVAQWNAQVRALVAEVLKRAGQDADPVTVLALVDGLVITALAEGDDPRSAAVRGLSRLLGAAPSSRRA